MRSTAPMLSQDERITLGRLADIIAPAWGKMPSASDIRLSHAPMDRALQCRPDLVQPLRNLLAELTNSDAVTAIKHLERERPGEFSILMQAVAGAYYMDERVREALHYRGQRRRPPEPTP